MEMNDYEFLNKIDGITISAGLEACGNEKLFTKFLTSFYNNIDIKADEIEDAYKEGNISFYTIKVHSLKSTSRIIGAYELSDIALELEEAGRKDDIEFINDNNDKLLALFRSYKEKLSILDEIDTDSEDKKKPIDNAELEDAYKSMAEVSRNMDYDGAEMIIEELKKRKLPAKEREFVDRLDKALKNFAWDEIEDLLSV